MNGHPKGWTLIRVREETKALLDAEIAWMKEAHTSGRSRSLDAADGVTIDQVVRRAIQFLQAERRRKNQAKKQKPQLPR